MSDQLFDPNNAMNALNLSQFVGLAGAPFVEQVVQYLKEQWALSTKLAPLASLLVGVVVNIVLALFLQLPLGDAAVVGAATGLLASGWYVISK